MSGRPANNDSLLIPLFTIGDEAARSQAIHHLLTRHATPQVDRLLDEEVARGRLAAADRPDLASEIVLRLLGKLHDLVKDADSEPIGRLPDYISATTHNALDDYLRRRDPLRRRLAIRIRYVLTHTSRFALWRREPVLCGLAEWSGRLESVPVAAPGPLVAGITDDASELRRIVGEVLRRSGGPVELRALVGVLAAALGLHPQPFVPTEALAGHGIESDALDRLEGRQYLDRLWAEIVELPPRQRRAMLLQLRLEDGESVSRVLVALGITRAQALAESLDMALPELLDLWNDLPLSDQRIAAMLGATRQQVINLRKSARERLARRMGRPR